MVIRRAGGVACVVLAAVFGNTAVRIVTEESMLADSGQTVGRIVGAFVPMVLAAMAGIWLLTSKPARTKASVYMGQAAGVSPLAVVTGATTLPPPRETESHSAEWHPCAQCGHTTVTNVETTSTCTCGHREKVAGTVVDWSACPRCAASRQANAFVARCAACGAVRRGSVG